MKKIQNNSNNPNNQNNQNNQNNKQIDLIQYNLLNNDNYNDTIHNAMHEILDNYVLLITEYMVFLNEKINITNKIYFQYIFTRGLDTITNVFNGMLFYTKNLDLAFYHGQKSFYFYVEFIEITETQNIFLKLSSRDATIFAYKRTLYEINNEYVKTQLASTKENNIQTIMKLLNIYCEIYKSISSFFINNHFIYEPKPENINKFAFKLTAISEQLNYLITNSETPNNILLLINSISNKSPKIEHFFELIDEIIKKISKGNVNIDK